MSEAEASPSDPAQDSPEEWATRQRRHKQEEEPAEAEDVGGEAEDADTNAGYPLTQTGRLTSQHSKGIPLA